MREGDKQRILRAYQVKKSIRVVSRLTGKSYGTIYNVLKEKEALIPWSGFDRIKRWKGGNRGPVSRWISLHENVVLPVRNKEIASLVGCKLSDVHSWKVARWAKIKHVLKVAVPKKIIKSLSYNRLEVTLIDGSVMGADELFRFAEELRLEKEGKVKK